MKKTFVKLFGFPYGFRTAEPKENAKKLTNVPLHHDFPPVVISTLT